MIALIRGTKISVKDGVATVDVNGVGYEIFVNEPDWEGCLLDFPFTASYYTHTNCPQDGAMELYGFAKPETRTVFRRLLSIDGVGPKLAFRVAHNCSAMNNVATLKCVRGVGDKIASRIAEEFANG